MSAEKKDFIKITEMSAQFDEAEKRWDRTKECSTMELHRWQLRFQLAIAQQLSVISSRLGEIVAKAKE